MFDVRMRGSFRTILMPPQCVYEEGRRQHAFELPSRSLRLHELEARAPVGKWSFVTRPGLRS